MINCSVGVRRADEVGKILGGAKQWLRGIFFEKHFLVPLPDSEASSRDAPGLLFRAMVPAVSAFESRRGRGRLLWYACLFDSSLFFISFFAV
jgi:hypothetical protein